MEEIKTILIIGLAGGAFGWLASKWLTWLHERYTKEVPESQKELTYDVQQQRVFRVRENFDVTFSTCKVALGLIKKSKIKRTDTVNKVITASVGLSFRSFGEKLMISIKEDSPYSMEVCIESKPKVWTTSMDYGKSFENVEIVSAHLKATLLID